MSQFIKLVNEIRSDTKKEIFCRLPKRTWKEKLDFINKKIKTKIKPQNNDEWSLLINDNNLIESNDVIGFENSLKNVSNQHTITIHVVTV